MLQSTGQNQKWPTSGPSGYITPAVWGIPYASERGIKSDVPRRCTQWLHNPCRWGIANASEHGIKNKWPTSGPSGNITPTVWGMPYASERETKSEVAHKWAQWLHNPRRRGGPQCFRAGDRVRCGRQMGPVAT